MDREKKLEKLDGILKEWLNYSKLWNEVSVTIVTRTKVERVTREPRRTKDGLDYFYTEQFIDKIPPTEFVQVKYFNPKIDSTEKDEFQTIEFPLTDLDTRIDHYENKVKTLKSKVV